MQEISVVSDPVMLHVWSCLHNYAYDDALFAAERLYAETQSSESLYLLATSLYRIGRPKQVSRLLTSVEPLNSKSRYLLAKCYFDFGLLNEAEDALLGHCLSSKSVDEVAIIYGEQAGYAILLLGDIHRRQGRMTDASRCYKKCLDLNPMLWSAFKNLCDIGDFPNPTSAFHLREGLTLPTPTYRVVQRTVDTGSSQTDYHSLFNQTSAENNELEVIYSRENVNPEKYCDKPILPSSTLLHDKVLSETVDTTFLHRTYVTHCSQDQKVASSLEPIQPMDFLKTPQCIFAMPVVPKAPKPEQMTRNLTKSLLSGQASCLEFPALGSPKFGSLALLSQSPMFACVPVFHKLSTSSTTSDMVLSTSVRYGNNQTAPFRQCGQNESVPTTVGVRPHGPSNTVVTRRRSRPGDSEVGTRKINSILHSASTSCVEKTHFNARPLSEQTTTSTPASVVNSLRRLVSSVTPSSILSSGHSNLAPTSAFCINSPSHRREPPLLRSTSQRGVSSGSSVLASKASVPLLNLNSPTGTTVSSSSTPRPSVTQQLTSPRPMIADLPLFDESQSSGPRTRSQVAAAAAVARASGIQRRSNRLVRSRGTSRKLDIRQARHVPVDSTPVPKSPEANVSFEEKSDASEFPTVNSDSEPNSVPFGLTTHSNDLITLEIPVINTEDPRVDSIQKYLNLLVHLGKAYQLLTQHDWRSATRLLSKLPINQLATGRVLVWAARAHMDNADYTTAQKLFSEVRRLEPWQLIGMDFYSTSLWQLQADQELSQLAHELLELDRNAPEPWCAAGNCFSLQGEHEVATRFFQRAIQVCPTGAYIFTLLGHELSTLEEFDRALTAFRHALRLDPRQYNAMFGMSNVYYKQEKFELAEMHLSRAVELFPHSHLLLTNLGALRGRLGHLDDGPECALALVTKACKIQPNNPLARYHRSSILFHLGRYTEVLTELQKLLALTPREAMVYLMIGHTYKKLGHTPQAMIHYSWAMGLDPKGANTHLRDIMTNPPVAGRSLSLRAISHSESAGVENTGVIGTGSTVRTTRSRLPPVLDGVHSDVEEGGESTDDVALPTEPGFIDPDIQPTGDETISSLLNSAHFTGPNSLRRRVGTRHLTDFSLLYDTEEYEEDAVLSGAEDDEDHYETMDLSEEVAESSGHSITDD
ncbi:Anaphase-promoting complex subunit 3 [Paragonimus heterotremus]|uniref:Cell division cycle protein 27 homolog n=1 Tax=Paragonimus heterotremus TaxID=100268 RepID=A0A8J4WHY2_9TREM|nr:Anaphase-promoting complex subunit 3 [Paragonimus heterotremus]